MLLFCFILSVSVQVLLGQDLNMDTIYVNTTNTSYIILPKKIDLVDIGNPKQYMQQFQENSVFVKALVQKAGISTILIKCGSEYDFGIIKYVEKNQRFLYDFSKRVGKDGRVGGATSQQSAVNDKGVGAENIESDGLNESNDTNKLQVAAKKFVKISNEISTLGFVSSFIDAAVTAIRNDKDKTYLKVLIQNKASLPYKLEFISFQYFQEKKKGSLKKSVHVGSDVFPLYIPSQKSVPTLKTSALCYVIPSFALADNGYLMVIFREEQGDRILKIKISSKDLLGAALLEDYIKNGK